MTPYEEGKEACKAGLPPARNPYKSGTPEYLDWISGYEWELYHLDTPAFWPGVQDESI